MQMNINYTVCNPWGTYIKRPTQAYINLVGITDSFALLLENDNKRYSTRHSVDVG